MSGRCTSNGTVPFVNESMGAGRLKHSVLCLQGMSVQCRCYLQAAPPHAAPRTADGYKPSENFMLHPSILCNLTKEEDDRKHEVYDLLGNIPFRCPVDMREYIPEVNILLLSDKLTPGSTPHLLSNKHAYPRF